MAKKKESKDSKPKNQELIKIEYTVAGKKKIDELSETESPEQKGTPEAILNDVTKLPAESEEKDERKDSKRRVKVKALFANERVLTENSNEARELYLQSRYGVVLEDGQVQLSLHEALYLSEKGKLELYDQKKKKLEFSDFMKKAKKVEPNFWVRYAVFKDMRTRGYIIKTALKFGADFRVYDRGVKPGEDHARWVVYPVHEGSTLTWYEFAAKNRVAHSTKKRLMLAVVDDELDVTYWEVKWVRP
jgi:tRNA-intron endonuclease